MKVYRVPLIDMNSVPGNGGWGNMLLSISVLVLNLLLAIVGTIDLIIVLTVHGILYLYTRSRGITPKNQTAKHLDMPKVTMSPIVNRKDKP
jgi:hypothetical protein